jgi:hypothetical protein
VNIPRSALIGFPLATVLAVGAYFGLRPTDESRIRGKLGALADAVHITESDMQTNPIGRLAHVSGAFEPLFDRDVRVSIPELTTLSSGRRELAELVTTAPRYVRTFDVDFDSVTVKIDDTATGALVGATANVKALDRDNRTRNDKRAVDFRFAKQDGEWIITTLSVWPKSDAAPQ